MGTQVAFSSSDDVISNTDYVTQLSVVDPHVYFEVQKCVEFINTGNYKNVVLQFPDELMSYANYVHEAIAKVSTASIYVLGDTSYGSCCVDEVAASHVDAHSIIHFGHSCLSSTQQLPVLYVFGRQDLDRNDFIIKLKNMYVEENEKILLFYDVSYSHCINQMAEELITAYPNIVITSIDVDNISNENVTSSENGTSKELVGGGGGGGGGITHCCCFGRNYVLQCEITSYAILYIGGESLLLRNLIFKYTKNKVYSYNPCSKEIRLENTSVNRTLMKRYYLIEKAKDANIVGIIMGTLGVSRYKEMVTRLKQVLTHRGKKFYTFVIGKINVAKMANFMEIDVFVLIACPENSLIDSKEFYKPILTPYEIEIACLETRQWTGDYITDFSEILPGSTRHVDVDNDILPSEPEYSLITGQLRTNPKCLENGYEKCTDLIRTDHEKQVIAYSAENYLSERSWTGLEINSGKSEIKPVEEGRSGIAMEYKNEPSENE